MVLNTLYLETTFLAVMVLYYGIQCMYKECTYRKCIVAFNNIYRKLFKLQKGESNSPAYVNNNVDCNFYGNLYLHLERDYLSSEYRV